MKITKATVKRINAHSNINKPGYVDAISILGEILNRSAVILGGAGRYELNDGTDPLLWPCVYSDGNREFISGRTHSDYEKRIIAGLATIYPNWISSTFTHGLNGVDIYDANKLVKAILDI